MVNKDNVLRDRAKSFFKSFFLGKPLSHAIILECGEEELLDLVIKEISKYALCSNKTNEACGGCLDCQKVEKGIHPDIKEYKPESVSKSLPVETIRDIRKDAYIKPNEACAKVYVLKNCDNMSKSSSNAFLKVLEEPPSNVIFILTCISCPSLMDTIKSRCQCYSLSHGNDLNYENQQAYDIIEALVKKNEADLLVSLSVFSKNRDLLFETTKSLETIFHRSLMYSFGAKYELDKSSDLLYKLSESFTKKALVYLVEESRLYQKRLKQNANINLLITDMCVSLYRSFSL